MRKEVCCFAGNDEKRVLQRVAIKTVFDQNTLQAPLQLGLEVIRASTSEIFHAQCFQERQ